jgi:cytochrome P450
MSNPARFTRIVPAGGFEVRGTYPPAGTDVGAAPYVLHQNPLLFPEPWEFRPEGWLGNKFGERSEFNGRLWLNKNHTGIADASSLLS